MGFGWQIARVVGGRGRCGRFARFAALLLCLGGIAAAAPPRGPVQQFQQVPVFNTGSWPVFLATADFNGDGLPDILYIDQGATGAASTTHVVLRVATGGTIGFAPSTAQTLATAGTSVAVGDFTGHRHVDIAWVTNTGSAQAGGAVVVHVAPGNGDGTFGATQTAAYPFTPAPGPQQTQVWGYLKGGQIRSSGPMDVLVEDTANQVLWVLNFATTQDDGGGPIGNYGVGPLQVVDVNRDGLNDVVLYSPALTRVSTLKNRGGHIDIDTYSVWTGLPSAIVQDMNGDGIPDLVGEQIGGVVNVYLGAGDGTFATTPYRGTGAGSPALGVGGQLIAVADANHDGVPDLLTSTPVGLSSLLGQGTGYALQGIYNQGPGHSSYAVADFSGDGNLDVAVDSPEGIAILYGNADGSFQAPSAFAAGQPALSGAMGHFTSSGYFDAVVGTEPFQGQVLLGAGDGTFRYLGSPNAAVTTTAADATTAGLWGSVQTADFNGDGLSDLLFTEDGPTALLPGPSGSGVTVQSATGGGAFGAPIRLGSNMSNANCTHASSLLIGQSVIADFNGDGIPDMANRDAHDTFVFETSPGGTHPVGAAEGYVADTVCSDHAHDQVAAGDFNGDGLTDLIVQTDGHLTLQLNQGQQPNNNLFRAAAGDLSVDGSLTTPGQLTAPVLSATFGGTVATSAGGLGFPAAIGSMAVADLDGDGKLDLIVVYANLAADLKAPSAATPNYLYVWFGSGGGKFLATAAHPVNPLRVTLSRNYYQVVVAQLIPNGSQQLVLSDGYIVSIFLANGPTNYFEEHYLAGQGINTISAVDLRRAGVKDLVVANGGAVLSNPVASGGTLAANADVNTGGVTVLLQLQPQVLLPVTGTVAASPGPSIYAQPFTLNATLVQPAGQPAPGGTVTFSIDGTPVGTATVLNGAASFSLTTAAILANTTTPAIFEDGAHTLTALYSGDANYSMLTISGSHTVQGQPTVSTFANLDQTIYYGQEIGYDYGVDAIFGATAADPTESYNSLSGGIIDVYVNSTLACSDVFGVGGRCPDAPFEGFSVGTYSTYVVYHGNAYYAPSTSVVYPVVVIPDYTGTTVASSSNPSFEFQPLLLTANVVAFYQPIDPTATTPIPVGTVQFFDGTLLIGSATLNAQGVGTASVATLLLGTHSITACYVVSLNFRASCSPVLTQVITLPAAAESTVTLLTSSANPSIVGQAVTFSAAVETTGAIVQTPAGPVSFYDGATLLSTTTLDKTGHAAFTTSALALGTHPIAAVYAGNALTAASTSAVLQQLVLVALPPASGYLLVVDPTSISVGVGDSVTVKVSIVVGSNASGQAFLLGCSQLPHEATCAFAQSTLPAGGGTTTLTVAAAAPHTCGTTTPYFVASGRRGALPWLGLAGLGLLFMRRRKARGLLLGLVMLASLLGTGAATGCGGPCTDLGTQPFDYSFFVTATEQGAPAGTAYTTETQAMQMHVHL